MGQLPLSVPSRLEERIEDYADVEHDGNRNAAIKHLLDRGLASRGYGDVSEGVQTQLSNAAGMFSWACLILSLVLIFLHLVTPMFFAISSAGFLSLGLFGLVVREFEPKATLWYKDRQRERAFATDGGK